VDAGTFRGAFRAIAEFGVTTGEACVSLAKDEVFESDDARGICWFAISSRTRAFDTLQRVKLRSEQG